MSDFFQFIFNVFTEWGVFLTLPINWYTNHLIVKISWKGWALKLIMDVYFVYVYIANYLINPSNANIALLMHMAIYIYFHSKGFIEWRRKDNS